MTFVLILYFDWLQGPHIGQNFEKHSKIFFSETVKGIKPVLCIHVPDSSLYIICVFYTPGIYEVYRGYIVFVFSVKMFVCVCVCVNFFSVKDFSGTA